MKLQHTFCAIVALIVLVACGNLTPAAVARVENVSLTRQDLDARIARLQKGIAAQPADPSQPTPSVLDIEKELVNRFIEEQITLSVARQRQIAVSETEIDTQIDTFRTGIASSGSTIEEAVETQLGLPGPESTEFRQFVSFFIARQKLAETLVTTDTVRQKLNDSILPQTTEKVEQVHAAHILFRVEKPEDDAAAKTKAEETITKLSGGAVFADLAKELSQDPGSAPNGGDLGWAQRGQFVPEFDKAIFDELKPGEVSQTPLKTDFGYHIIQVIEREERPLLSAEDAQLQIDQALPQQLQQERAQALQELIGNERKKAKDEGRLVEPTYPDPTAVPAAPDQPPPAEAPTGEAPPAPTAQP